MLDYNNNYDSDDDDNNNNSFCNVSGVSFINAAYSQNGHIICVSNFPCIYPDLHLDNLY